jgi:hypothetical protein
MSRALWTLTAVAILVAAPARDTAAQEPTRAEVILKTVGDTGDGVLDQQELAAFLLTALPQRLAAMLGPGRLTVSPEWARDAAQFLMNQADATGSGRIEPAEFGDLEKARLFTAAGVAFGALLPPPAARASTRPLLDRVQRWLSIRRSFLDERDVARPATLSWRSLDDSDETLNAGFARRQWEINAAVSLVPAIAPLIWRRGPLEVAPVVGYEAHVTSGHKANADVITHRIGAQGSVLGSTHDLVTSHLFVATYDLITDSHYATEVRGWTLQYSPVAPRIAIGQLHPADGPFQFYWRPYVGLETSSVKDAAGGPELLQQADASDLHVKVSSQLRAFERVFVTPELTQFWPLNGDQDAHGLAELAIEIVVSEANNGDVRTSLELALVNGRRAPSYLREQSIAITLGFKF